MNILIISKSGGIHLCRGKSQAQSKKKDYFRRDFNPPRIQAGIRRFKNTFSVHTWTLQLRAALCFTWMRAEYRLGAACRI